MKSYRSRIKTLEQSVGELTRIIVMRGDTPSRVIVSRPNTLPPLTFDRAPDEEPNAFLRRAGCASPP